MLALRKYKQNKHNSGVISTIGSSSTLAVDTILKFIRDSIRDYHKTVLPEILQHGFSATADIFEILK